MFRIFDYTGATTLFGSELITAPPPEKGPPGPPPPPPPPVKVKGVSMEIRDTGRFHVMQVDGRVTRVTPGEYRAHLVEELTASVPSLADFRARWLQPEARAAMLTELARGLKALREGGDPSELLRRLKETLFAA